MWKSFILSAVIVSSFMAGALVYKMGIQREWWPSPAPAQKLQLQSEAQVQTEIEEQAETKRFTDLEKAVESDDTPVTQASTIEIEADTYPEFETVHTVVLIQPLHHRHDGFKHDHMHHRFAHQHTLPVFRLHPSHFRFSHHKRHKIHNPHLRSQHKLHKGIHPPIETRIIHPSRRHTDRHQLHTFRRHQQALTTRIDRTHKKLSGRMKSKSKVGRLQSRRQITNRSHQRFSHRQSRSFNTQHTGSRRGLRR